MKPSTDKKVCIKQIIIVSAIVAIITITVNLIPKGKSQEAQLKAEMEEYNKTLPQQIDEFTRLDSAKISPDKRLTYFNTVDVEKEEINYQAIEKFVHTSILRNIRKEPALRRFREMQYTWEYKYYDKNGILFHQFNVTPEMYK